MVSHWVLMVIVSLPPNSEIHKTAWVFQTFKQCDDKARELTAVLRLPSPPACKLEFGRGSDA